MIEVIVRMNVEGKNEQYYPLGKILISNDANHPGHPNYGNYTARLFSRNGRMFCQKIIQNHPRLRESVWSLIRKSLN